VAKTISAAPSVAADERIINRELSLLDFNGRVLELAADSHVPLLERVNFCAILSSNLDEFFMVRVAGLMDQAASGLAAPAPDGRTALQTLAEARERVLALSRTQSKLWATELCPALAAHGIEVARIDDLSKKELEDVERRFERDVYPVLTPLAVGPGQPFPYISGLSLSLGVFVRDPETDEERFSRVKVPETLPRFLETGRRNVLVPLESVIAHFLPRLFPEMEILERAAFRVTRDADFAVSDEADDLLEALRHELRRRRFGDVVRLEVSSSMSDAMVSELKDGLRVSDEQVYPVRGLLDLADAVQIARLDRPELKYDVWPGVTRRPFTAPSGRELFTELRRADALVHLPYDSFAGTVESFVRAAAADPDVRALKTTVYRTSDDSALAPSLIEASEEGKEAVCLVELKARFDEHRNIEWSRRLEQAGVHVVHGFPRLKIHAKTTLVVRRERDGLRRYVHIGTGNYHALTARMYEDLGLFTADEAIAADVAELFNYLTGFGRPSHFRKLLVAPFTLRSSLLEEIAQVREAAAAGQPASIRIKVNALHDEEMIEALYAASTAGARIDVITRRICGLRPGVPGMSENVHVRSVLGRFLEHSRIFVFQAGERTRYFLGSSDLLPRNLDYRIEVVVPIETRPLQTELDAVLDALLSDNAQAWQLRSDGSWERLSPRKNERRKTAQGTLIARARARVRRQVAPSRVPPRPV
jgi:polyphosphate kinase